MLRTLSLAFGIVALAAGRASAMGPETLVVHVPFAFSVDNVKLPPGDYQVHPLSDLQNDVVEIRAVDGRHALLVLTAGAPPEPRGARAELVFDRYGTERFLRAVELPEQPGASLPPTRSEIVAARGVASHQTAQPRTSS
jgi:hypothetical protein